VSEVITEILPPGVVAIETRVDLPRAALFGVEREALGRAVERRRLEFTTARACARRALAGLGLPAMPIPSGPRGEPCWPEGVVGSITHCEGYRACAVARAAEFLTVGIDAEPDASLPDGVLTQIATVEELPRLRALSREWPAVHWDRLLFSAKEAVYKAWFPLFRHPLGFTDAVLSIDPHGGSFRARLSVSAPARWGQGLTMLDGRWMVDEGLVLTAIALAVTPAPGPHGS
jgi:4'-phosphopantetheinyl transferase EntD